MTLEVMEQRRVEDERVLDDLAEALDVRAPRQRRAACRCPRSPPSAGRTRRRGSCRQAGRRRPCPRSPRRSSPASWSAPAQWHAAQVRRGNVAREVADDPATQRDDDVATLGTLLGEPAEQLARRRAASSSARPPARRTRRPRCPRHRGRCAIALAMRLDARSVSEIRKTRPLSPSIRRRSGEPAALARRQSRSGSARCRCRRAPRVPRDGRAAPRRVEAQRHARRAGRALGAPRAARMRAAAALGVKALRGHPEVGLAVRTGAARRRAPAAAPRGLAVRRAGARWPLGRSRADGARSPPASHRGSR